MEARELRIGNIVNCQHHYNDCPDTKKFNVPIEIESIRRDSVTLSTFQDVNIKYLSGIPLTEERIFDLGFIKSDRSNEYWTFYVLPNGWYISQSHHNEPSAGVKEGCFYWGDNFIEIKYIHKLQNIYYALTTQELNQLKK